MLALIQEVAAVMGDREAVLCREMTKTYEEFIRGRLSDILNVLSERADVKGECTFLVAGCGEDDTPSPETHATGDRSGPGRKGRQAVRHIPAAR